MKKLLLVIILLTSVLLRFVGIKPGYPPYHSDEGMSYSQGISIIKEGTLDASGYSLHYAYPGLIPMIHAGFYKTFFIPIEWGKYFFTNIDKFVDGYIDFPFSKDQYKKIFQNEILGVREINVLHWGRYITALFGVGVVFVTYELAKTLFDENVGLISSFLVAVNYRQVLNSHIALPDIYNAFFLLLSILISYRIVKKPTKEIYLLSGIFVGLSISTKFHIYSVFAVTVAHIYSKIKQDSFNWKIFVPDSKFLILAIVSMITVLIINPYHFLNIETMLNQLSGVAGKYRSGRMALDFYPYSYLYHFGIGKLTSLLVVGGLIMGLLRRFKESAYLLSVIVPFFFIITYYTGGGFYTRNFVTITPILLIFAGYLLSKMIEERQRIFFLIAFVVLFSATSYENLSNSVVVAKEYEKQWNFKIAENWIDENIPYGSAVAAHSSVPLTPGKYQRATFELDDTFSIEEFKEDGAEWAVMNMDWATTGFYGWMGQNMWKKPIDMLEKTFAAMAIREFSDFAAYSVLNPWQAPDSNFVVAKLPEYEHERRGLLKQFVFEEPPEDKWKTEALRLDDFQGLVIEYLIRVEAQGEDVRGGFLAIHFYEDGEDIGDIGKRTAVRLSPRSRPEDGGAKELVIDTPENARYALVEFGNYNPARSTAFLEQLVIYQADVTKNFGEVEINPVELDNNIVFPNSHGNL